MKNQNYTLEVAYAIRIKLYKSAILSIKKWKKVVVWEFYPVFRRFNWKVKAPLCFP